MEVEKLTVIDAQTEIEGKLKGKDARIFGRFRGDIELTGRIILGEGSRVEAKIAADAAEISGEYKGDISVRSLVLMEKARVQGGVEAQSLAVREGAQINGTINAGSSNQAKPAAGAPAG
ncbi:MAG: polymer-forming cytoskeletal protein [Vicinamibacteria bacterium]|nr:polymer-forming cytoskeletal protein [Vicinamibacteria bacterium]